MTVLLMKQIEETSGLRAEWILFLISDSDSFCSVPEKGQHFSSVYTGNGSKTWV